MPRERFPNLSYSFEKLRKLSDTFAAAEAVEGRPTQALQSRATSLAITLGETCVPLLLRKLCGPSERQASWAFHLCGMVGGPRIVREIDELLAGTGRGGSTGSASRGGVAPLKDERKALLLALLVELGAPLPEVRFSDADRLAESSVRELMQSLETPDDVAQAADLIIAHVPGDELSSFLAELVSESGGDAMRLLDALVEHSELPTDTLERIHALRVVAAPERRPGHDGAKQERHCRVVVRPKRARRRPRHDPPPPEPAGA